MNELLNALGAITSSQTLNMILLGVLIYVGILWIALILWVTKDITNRTNNMFFQIFSISLLIFLTPIFGLPLYLVIRPSRTLMERYFEDVEQDMIEQYYDSVERLDNETASAETGDTVVTTETPSRPNKKTAPRTKAKTRQTAVAEDTEDDLD